MTVQTIKRYTCLSAESMFCALSYMTERRHSVKCVFIRGASGRTDRQLCILHLLIKKPLTRKLRISHVYASCSSKFAADINHVFLGETITATPALRLWFWHQSDAQCQEVFGMAIAFWQSLPQHYTSSSSMNIFSISAVNVNKELHYRPGILGRSAGPTRSRLHLRVTS